jgi:sec-independent protein translocase protein TatB
MHINISEILLVLLVALLVIKPEQLPDAAKRAGRWIKLVRQSIAKIKNEIEQ